MACFLGYAQGKNGSAEPNPLVFGALWAHQSWSAGYPQSGERRHPITGHLGPMFSNLSSQHWSPITPYPVTIPPILGHR